MKRMFGLRGAALAAWVKWPESKEAPSSKAGIFVNDFVVIVWALFR